MTHGHIDAVRPYYLVHGSWTSDEAVIASGSTVGDGPSKPHYDRRSHNLAESSYAPMGHGLSRELDMKNTPPCDIKSLAHALPIRRNGYQWDFTFAAKCTMSCQPL